MPLFWDWFNLWSGVRGVRFRPYRPNWSQKKRRKLRRRLPR